MIWWLTSVAIAQQSIQVDASMGLDVSTANRFLKRRGLRLGGAARHDRLPLGATASVAWYPYMGQLDWTDRTEFLVQERQLAPSIARELGQALAGVEVTALRGNNPALSSALRFALLGGAVYTQDDLEVGQREDDPEAIETMVQVHPTIGWSVAPEVMVGRVGIRGRFAQTLYVENFLGDRMILHRTWLGCDLVFRTRLEVRKSSPSESTFRPFGSEDEDEVNQGRTHDSDS